MDFFTEIYPLFNWSYLLTLLFFHLIYHMVTFQHMTIKKMNIDDVDTPPHVRSSVLHFLRTYALIKSEAKVWLPLGYFTCFFLQWIIFKGGSMFLDIMAYILTIISAYVNLYYEVNLDLNDSVDPIAQALFIFFHCFNFNHFGPLSFWGARFAWSIIIV